MKFNKIKSIALMAGMLALSATGMQAATTGESAENIYLYHNSNIVFMERAAAVDSIAWEENHTRVTLYDAEGKALYSSEKTTIDSISFAYTLPEADLLDVRFNADGTATDVSPMKNNIEVFGNEGLIDAYYNPLYGRNTGTFVNNWGTGSLGDEPKYCKVNYENNEAFKKALADGHTIETIFKASYTPPIDNAEAKWFSSHEAGGTGLMICKTGNGKNGTNEITFLPNVSTTGGSSWKWVTSGIVPEPETYYHVVGVWNQEEGKAYIYVNGELCNTVDAVGNFVFPKAGSQWFGIGCDSGPSGQFGGNWEIVTAKVYDAPLTTYDVEAMYEAIAADTTVPQADILDIVFKTDGTAEDVSPMGNKVTTAASDALYTYYNPDFDCYAAHFDNSYGSGTASGYYRVDYATNPELIEALASGHTLETVVMAAYSGNITDSANNVEAKFFTSHEAGGTGFMVCKTGNGKNGTNEWTFLPNVSTTGGSSWKWVTSGIVPEKNVFYHIVGVWDKEAGKAYIYVNGQLCNTVDAVGDLHFPASQYQWFGIGCDAGPSAQLGWKGDVVTCRIYDDPLTPREVELLWSQVEKSQSEATPAMIENVNFFSGAAVKTGGKFTVTGTGFQEGDRVELTEMAEGAEALAVETTVGEGEINITIPEGMKSGLYRMMLYRGTRMQDLGLTRINVVEKMPVAADIIAHRGYWKAEGAAQNSRASLKAAIDLDLYGSEIDIWLTTDGHLLVNHDASYNGVTIKDATSEQCKSLILSNGENMPELEDLLDIMKESTNRTKLIIEIKDHGTASLNKKAATAAVEAVKAAGLQDKVEYISFSDPACQQVIADDPDALVAYLTGGVAPATLQKLGYTGLDYHMAEFRDHPEWITAAHELGMTVNVWTVTSTSDITETMNKNVDFITTDDPVTSLAIKAYYDSHQE